MSYQSNLDKKKCWSCSYYCGKREYKERIFGNPSIHCDDTGVCSCNKSTFNGKVVKENFYCSRYAQWGVISGAIAKRRESDAYNQEQVRKTRERNEEYKKWYNSLSEEGKRREDAKREKEVKVTVVTIFSIIGLIVLIVLMVSGIKSCQSNQETNTFVSYIKQNKNYNYITNSINVTKSSDDASMEYKLEYKKDYFKDELNYYSQLFDFKNTIRLTFCNDDFYNTVESYFLFNLKGSNNTKTFESANIKFGVYSYIYYMNNYRVRLFYRNLTYNKNHKTYIQNGDPVVSFSSRDAELTGETLYDVEVMGLQMCLNALDLTDELYKNCFGSSITSNIN